MLAVELLQRLEVALASSTSSYSPAYMNIGLSLTCYSPDLYSCGPSALEFACRSVISLNRSLRFPFLIRYALLGSTPTSAPSM